ncbi:type II secretion system protein [uncultured Sulfuricurvum sp.]|uniref:type II secretion system protein n=1 Tax=uncultured Sulfuricurvum sp. TaxID=430693 RepID=UPI0026111801|nr:type II secretion system protein [uncultured Sulfuricurvum sp.]
MRKGLTLIELILSMVIIGIVFTVIPRLIMSMNQSTKVIIKEEAMYNAMAKIGSIINLPWDEKNTDNDQILSVTNHNNYDCNLSNIEAYYRLGGFIGSRNCRLSGNGLLLSASSLGHDNIAMNDYNDIDDFNGTITVATGGCDNTPKYTIGTTVIYTPDNGIGSTTGTTNTKTIQVKIGYNIAHKFYDPAKENCIVDLNYTAYNIGHIQINHKEW